MVLPMSSVVTPPYSVSFYTNPMTSIDQDLGTNGQGKTAIAQKFSPDLKPRIRNSKISGISNIIILSVAVGPDTVDKYLKND